MKTKQREIEFNDHILLLGWCKPQPHHVRADGHSSLWQPLLKWSQTTCSGGRGLQVPLQGRRNTADSHERHDLKKEMMAHPLWWECLSRNNECKSSGRMCFWSSLISTWTLFHFGTQTHNFTNSQNKFSSSSFSKALPTTQSVSRDSIVLLYLRSQGIVIRFLGVQLLFSPLLFPFFFFLRVIIFFCKPFINRSSICGLSVTLMRLSLPPIPTGCTKEFKSVKLCNPTAHGKRLKTRQLEINLKWFESKVCTGKQRGKMGVGSFSGKKHYRALSKKRKKENPWNSRLPAQALSFRQQCYKSFNLNTNIPCASVDHWSCEDCGDARGLTVPQFTFPLRNMHRSDISALQGGP